VVLGGLGLWRGATREWSRDARLTDTEIGLRWLPEEVARHRPLILRAAVEHAVDPRLVAIIVLVESRGNPAARSPVGARGLMQVMPATGRYVAKQRGLQLSSPNALYDASTNLDYGTWFLARLLERFATDDETRTVELAAGAYNGGPGRMRRHLERGRRLPPETRHYMAVVTDLWREREAPQSSTLAQLWPSKGPSGHA